MKAKKVLMAMIQTSVEFYDMIVEKYQLSKEEIALEYMKYQPWLDSSDIKFTKRDNSKISFDERVNQLIYSDQPVDSNKLKESINKKMESLTFVIDEANILTKKFPNQRSYYQELSTAIRSLFIDYNIVFAITSTDISIAEFKPNQNKITNSQRSIDLDYYPPFCKLVYCDQLKSKDYERNFKNAFEIDKNLMNFINEIDPKNGLFYYGRPLWSSIESANNHLERENILILAENKLTRSQSWIENSKMHASLAVLASTTNILNNIAIINHEFSSSLISGYMATLFHQSDNCNVLSFRYVSEPILAEAANSYISDYTRLKKILIEFRNALASSNIVLTGNIGETIAEIIIIIDT